MYEKFKSKFARELGKISPKTAHTEIHLSNFENLTEKCVNLSQNLSKIWVSGDTDEKHRLQKLVFGSEIYYNKQKSIYLTPKVNSVLFQMSQLSRDSSLPQNKKPTKNIIGSHRVARTGMMLNPVSIKKFGALKLRIDQINSLRK